MRSTFHGIRQSAKSSEEAVWFIPGTSYNEVYVYRRFLSRTNTDFSVPKKSAAVPNTYGSSRCKGQQLGPPLTYVCRYGSEIWTTIKQEVLGIINRLRSLDTTRTNRKRGFKQLFVAPGTSLPSCYVATIWDTQTHRFS
jgi:hypothetical protein